MSRVVDGRVVVRDVFLPPLRAASLLVVCTALLVAIFAPLLAAGDPHVDAFSRLVHATRTSVLAGCLGVTVALALGVLSGLVTGTHRGRIDAVVGWAAYLMLSAPAIVFLVAVVAQVANNVAIAIAVLGALAAPLFHQLTRSAVLTAHDSPYIEAGPVGRSGRGLIARRAASELRRPLIRLACFTGAGFVVIHSGLTLLGLGDPTVPSWGAILHNTVRGPPGASDWTPLWLLIVTVAALMALGVTPARRALEGEGEAAPLAQGIALILSVADRANPHAPGVASDPVPSTWFRSSAVLDVRGLHVSPAAEADAELVTGISLSVTRGEVVGLFGEPGCGTAEIALAVTGLLPATAIRAGSIMFNGIELVGMSERGLARLRGLKISYVPRQPAGSLDPSFTVGSQLAAPMRINLGLSRAAAVQRSLELLDRVGIVDPRTTFQVFPRELSEGAAQRVLIAGAISCDPELLVADEPTAALDGIGQTEILDLLRDLQTERQLTMILATHSFGIIADYCHRVAVVRSGAVVEYASVQELVDSPRHPYTRHLLNSSGRAARSGLSHEESAPPLT